MAFTEADFRFESAQAEIIAVGLFQRGEVLFGDYTLRSGAWSPFYTDLRPTASAVENNPSAPGMTKRDQLKFRNTVVAAYAGMLGVMEGEFEHISGIPEAVSGIAPMVALMTNESYLHRRIKQKDYGAPSDGILGDFNPGDRLVLLDDLISSSGAKVDEKNLIEDISRSGSGEDEERGPGLIVRHALILLDRETGGIQKAAEAGLAVHAGMDFSTVLDIGYGSGVVSNRNYKIAKAYMAGELTAKEDIPNFI